MLPLLLGVRSLSAANVSSSFNGQFERSASLTYWDILDTVKDILLDMTLESYYSIDDISELDTLSQIFLDLNLGSVQLIEFATRLEQVFDTYFNPMDIAIRMNYTLGSFCDYLIRYLDN